jgi:hypothetical protein
VLDPAAFREDLPEFLLRDRADVAFSVDDQRPGAGCALIERQDILPFGHARHLALY